MYSVIIHRIFSNSLTITTTGRDVAAAVATGIVLTGANVAGAVAADV